MRLILRLRARGNFTYDVHYHSKLQGLIYRFLMGSGYGELHDMRGYKFFTFSNPFPVPRDLRVADGSAMNLIMASPSEDLIRRVYGLLQARYIGSEVHVGDMSFELLGASLASPRLSWRSVLVTSTPVVVRIPESAYDELGVPPDERRPGFIYWRPRVGIGAFLRSVEANLIRKFREFHGWEPRVDPRRGILEIARLVKAPVVVRIPTESGSVPVVGSTWKFYFTSMDRARLELLRFALDAGLGERNSMGFGFLNVLDERVPALTGSPRAHPPTPPPPPRPAPP